MNKFQKLKQSTSFLNSNFTEDSSDYVNSDVEVTVQQTNTNNLKESNSSISQLASNLADDSNDSFIYDKDNDNSSSNFSYTLTQSGDNKKIKLIKASYHHQANQQNQKQPDLNRLVECLDYLHRMIGRKDKEDIFQYPVTDDIAPGYSTIIKKPMDLSTMRKKIDSQSYKTVAEYRDDLILMCENCMTYNKSDTIYYHAARKMLDYGLKLLSRDKLSSLRHTVRIMRYLTPLELGFSLDNIDASNEIDPNPQLIRKRAEQTQQKSFSATYTSRIGPNNSLIISKSKLLQNDSLGIKESYLLPPEGEDINEDNLSEQVKQLADMAANRLQAKNKNGKIGFLRRNSNGTLGYNFLNSSLNDKIEETEANEKPVTIGNLCEGLQPNSYSMSAFLEDKKNKNKPMYYIENGPFGTNAPIYDTSYSNISKEESDVLLTTYGDETAYQYALSLMEFSKGTGFMFNKYVNLVLNTLSNNEHEKYLQYLKKQQQQLQTESLKQDILIVKKEETDLG